MADGNSSAVAGDSHGSPAVRVRLLGNFEISYGGSVVPDSAFARRKSKSLVKLLALQPNYRLHREQALDLLWPALAPDAAASQLYNAVHQARKAFVAVAGANANSVLEFRRGMLSLHAPGGVDSDLRRFEELAARALETNQASHLEMAISAYGGQLLPEDLYEDWSIDRREGLQEVLLQLLGRLGAVHLSEGSPGDAIDAFERALALDIGNEESQHGLLRALAATGQRGKLEKRYRLLRDALEDELGVEPSEETETLYTKLADQHPETLPDLPHPATPFVGRTFELAEIEKRLADPECRLVTLVGLGGIGKTRLAIEAADRHSAKARQRACFIALPERCSADVLAALLADRLGTKATEPDRRAEHLFRDLAGRKLLLVLDNAENGVAAMTLVSELLGKEPGVKVLATSRQRLGIYGEWVVEVHGLEVPRHDSGADPALFGSVRLFLEGARRAGVQGDFGPEEMTHVLQVCRILQGVPLALELAASWLPALSCREIAEELRRGLDMLSSSSPDLPERHRSLRNAFEHSWRMLEGTEQHYFARLSLFQGGFRLDGAQRVTGLPLDVLSRLIAKSLVSKIGPERYQVHPVLRQYAAEKLSASGEVSDLQEAHGAYYIGLLREQETELGGDSERDSLSYIRPEMENIRTAWRHALMSRNAHLIGQASHGLFMLYEKLGWTHEGAEAFAQASEVLGEEPAGELTLGRVLGRRGAFERQLGKLEDARESMERSLHILERIGEPAELAFTLDQLALLAHMTRDDDGALRLLRRALAVREETGDLKAIATSLNNLGSMSFALQRLDDAERYCHESLMIQRQLGAFKAAAISLQNLASIAFAKGDRAEAERLLFEGLALSRTLGNESLTAIFLGNLGSAAAAGERHDEARTYYREALHAALSVGAESLALGFLPRVAALLQQRGDLEKAVEVCALLEANPLAAPELKAKAAQQFARLAGELPPQSIAGARFQSRTLSLRAAVHAWFPQENANSSPSPTDSSVGDGA